jgi:HSP20 family protein
MNGLVPFDNRSSALFRTGLEDFYNVLGDFFNEPWSTRRSLSRDTFKIDVRESDKEYLIEAELPGVKKEEIELSLDEGRLMIAVKKEENIDNSQNNYVHRERRVSSMCRGIYLPDAKPEGITARLDNGILGVSVAKQDKSQSVAKIEIQ